MSTCESLIVKFVNLKDYINFCGSLENKQLKNKNKFRDVIMRCKTSKNYMIRN